MSTHGQNLLMVAESEPCANMLYAARHWVRGPAAYLRLRNRNYLITSASASPGARRQRGADQVVSLEELRRAFSQPRKPRPSLARTLHLFLRQQRVHRVHVPAAFPFGLAQELERLGTRVCLQQKPVFPERATKSAEEIKKISAALIMAEVGLAEAMLALKSARIGKNRRLYYHNAPFTAEKLRAIIDTAVLQAGGQVARTVVAGGPHTCNGEECGHGPLRAGEPILLDVCPRSQRTGYFGDISRTVVKGRAPEAIRKLYHTVDRAHELAFSLLRAGTSCRLVHEKVASFFTRQGYQSDPSHAQPYGFLHHTGHGIGLDLCETPWIGPESKDRLGAGHVVTLRPGLYYPTLGGSVRIEDVILITGRTPRNLTRFEKTLEL